MSPHEIISSFKSRMWVVPSKSNCALILQHPTALLTHIYFATPYGQISAAMQPYLHAFHLTLSCCKMRQQYEAKQDLKKKKHVQNKHPCKQPVLITSLIRKENKKNLFSPQGYPVRRQGQRLSRRKGMGGPQKLHVSTGLQATLTLKLSEAKRHRTRRCQTNALFACPWKWERSWKAATYRMTQFLTSTARRWEQERERDKERVLGRESNSSLLDRVPAFFVFVYVFGTTSRPIHQLQLQRSFVEYKCIQFQNNFQRKVQNNFV